MSKAEKVYIFAADGTEEIECLTVVDLMRRAGIDIELVSITGQLELTGSHGIGMKADRLFEEELLESGCMFVLPGGMPGTKHLDAHEGLGRILKAAAADPEKKVAAICAAPSVLGHLGILEGKTAVCYPGFEGELTGAQIGTERVEVSGDVITSRGPGTAMAFALELIRQIRGDETRDKVADGLLYAWHK
ncbi:MAG: DJ-1/PfpI family protein [Lachnospiraceae bacterium]|nr:DJ-1/PfpI family protein [Lachnospiraceae bacterium]